nr:MAG TPA: hypothetical protein [Caudoviricetes sp.]
MLAGLLLRFRCSSRDLQVRRAYTANLPLCAALWACERVSRLSWVIVHLS